MKKNKLLLITSLITLLPAFAGILLWKELPDQMPIHFTGNVADGWGSKGFAVFGLPLMILAFHLVVYFATKLDKQNQTGGNRKVLDAVLYLFPLISLMSCGIVYAVSMGKTAHITNFVSPMMGLMFVVIGNYLPKCRINSTLGIKLKWTFHNEENWNKTHRFAGPLWVVGGLVQILFGLMGWYLALVLVAVPMAVAPMVYSYCLYKKQIASGAYEPGNPKISMSANAGRIARIISLSVVVLVALVLFSGGLEYTIEENFLHIDASMHADLTVDLSHVESIVFEEKAMNGTRVWGFGSPKLAMGTFQNDSLGTYTRYTYTQCKAYILLTVDGQYLVLNAETPEATRELYEQIRNAMPVLQ